LTNRLALVILVHAPVGFILSDNLTSILNDDLARIEAPHGAYTVSTVLGLCNFNTLSPQIGFPLRGIACSVLIFAPPFELSKGAITATFTDNAVRLITFVLHIAVKAILIAASLL
jgi:hypothetical protein